jgi:hypothetical protein
VTTVGKLAVEAREQRCVSIDRESRAGIVCSAANGVTPSHGSAKLRPTSSFAPKRSLANRPVAASVAPMPAIERVTSLSNRL